MGTDRDGLDSILAGNEEGAKGCCLSVDMTSDGIAVLSSDGYVLAPNGGAVAVCDHTYTELRQVCSLWDRRSTSRAPAGRRSPSRCATRACCRRCA